LPSDASKAESSSAATRPVLDTKIQDKKNEMLKTARSFGS
jgi:hypothetical protein